ncbi:MAG: hypothetical protein K5894_13265, partial [Lachnospiraceae bacterium]|nr:hypothetical protein [Lachnospiraceae bacterium]
KKESQSPTLIDITPALDNTMNLTKNTSDNYVTAPSAIIRKNGLEIEIFNTASTELINHLLAGLDHA